MHGGIDEDDNRLMGVVPSELPESLIGNMQVTADGDTTETEANGTGGGSQRATSSGLILRSSVRTQKRPVAANTTTTSPVTAAVPITPSPPANRVIRVRSVKRVSSKVVKKNKLKEKSRRAWEVWSIEAKKAFFEALCEYGKDFESIQAYVAQKTHKKGCPVQANKNKDQVRHFYYRTWHKISSYLDLSDDVKKQTQELYGLINYGKLRKKLRGPLNYQKGKKLNELVHAGATSLRCKGKLFRVKTPVCRALKRLFEIDDEKDVDTKKLPENIEIEFVPRDNRAWTRVQSVAHNPRLRMKVSLQQRFSLVIGYLQRRWIEPALKQRRALLDRTTAEGSAQEKAEKNEPYLRIRPVKNATLCKVALKEFVEVTSSSVSFDSYRRKMRGSDAPVESANCKKLSKGKARTSVDGKRPCREDVASPTADRPSISKKGSRCKMRAAATAMAASDPSQKDEDGGDDEELGSVHELTLKKLLALETAADLVSNETCDDGEELFARKRSFLCDAAKESSDNAVDGTGASAVTGKDSAVGGPEPVPSWTAVDCGALTVGGVFLLLDSPSKLVLEYDWESAPTSPSPSPPSLPLSSSSCSDDGATKLKTILARLLSLASSVVAESGKNRADRSAAPTVRAFGTSCRCSHQQACPLALSSANGGVAPAAGGRRPGGHPTTRGQRKAPTTTAAVVTSSLSSSSSSSSLSSSSSGGASVSRIPAFPAELTMKGSSSAQIATDIFRKPASIPMQSKATVLSTSASASANDAAFKEQLFKYRRTKGRSGNSMVVQRELLPKTDPASGVVTLSIIPTASQLAGSMPIRLGMPVLTNRSAALTTLANVVVPISQSASGTRTLKVSTTSMPTSSTLTLPISTLTARKSTPLSTARTPCTILISDDRVHQVAGVAGAVMTTPTTTTSSSTVTTTTTSRTSFANRIVVTTATSATPTTLTSFPMSKLNIQTGSSTILETNGDASSSIPVISISESGPRSPMSISPPTISSLLDISLTGTDTLPLAEVNLGSEDNSANKLLELNLGNSNTFSGLIDMTLTGKSVDGGTGNGNGTTVNPTLSAGNATLYPRPVTPSNSPISSSHFKLSSPGLENNWFNGDTSDFSLSNLLSHLESPIKVSASLTSTGLHSSEAIDTMARLAPDMDSQFRSLISESSIDYIAKFADLAAQIGKK